MRRHTIAAAIATASIVASTVPLAASASGATTSSTFYSYGGSTPLADIAPGTILKTRTITAHLQGLPLPIPATQFLYRTADATGRPTVTVTTLMQPLAKKFATPRLVAYQAAYDSLTAQCQPSSALAGNLNPLDALDSAETTQMIGFLTQGYTVETSDYEGENLAFAAGPGEGRQTLDSIRAVLHRLPISTKIGMIGYSGGAIATEWAAELAPTYAPDLTHRIVGSAQGGVFVDPAHNLRYVNGTPIWSGAIPAALVGITRAFHLDPTSWLSAYGKQVVTYSQDKCLTTMLGHWPGLTYQSLTSAAYGQNPFRIPAFVRTLNAIVMGAHGTPLVPMFIGQGTGGALEGTPGNQPGIGAGDGVMVAGDVRTLAREYCARHLRVLYHQYSGLDHAAAGVIFGSQAQSWLVQRFAGATAPSSCGSIPVGNSLALTPVPAP